MKMLEKLQKRLQQGKKDNKGFSLVELIIVIAIMAILIGIVGMNVIPQIENARKAKDIQVLSAFVTEAMEAYTQNVVGLPDPSYQIDITIASGKITAAAVTSGTNASTLAKSFNELAGLDKAIQLESNAGKDITSITIVCKNERPMITLTVGMKSGSKYSFDTLYSESTVSD